MKQLGLVIQREFLMRVKKTRFWLFSFVVPFLLSAIVLAPILINKSNLTSTRVIIFDQTQILGDILVKHNQNKYVVYEEAGEAADLEETIDQYDTDDGVVVLHIPSNFIKNQAPVVELFNKNTPGIYVISKVKSDLYDIRKKFIVYSTFKLDLQAVEERMNSKVTVLFQGEGLNPQMKFFLGFASTLLLYFLILLYGTQIMRGTLEEKSSRVVEIIVSSIRPKTLLNGKVLGLGLAGLLQFFLIIVFGISIVWIFQGFFDIETSDLVINQFQLLNQQGIPFDEVQKEEIIPLFNQEVQNYIAAVRQYLPELFLVTPVLMVLGYFLYASFFAIIGAAINNESDAQQFLFPVLVPLIVSGFIAYSVLQNPGSDLAFWASIFPLSSPIVMTARLFFMDLSTQWWEVALAICILIASTWICLRLAAKVYRVGILMYGQKASYKTLWKWFKTNDH